MKIKFGSSRMKVERHPMMRLLFAILLALLLDSKINENDKHQNQNAVRKQQLMRQIGLLDQEQIEMNQQLLQVQQLQEALEDSEVDSDKGALTMQDTIAQRVIEQGQAQRYEKFAKQLKQLQSNDVNSISDPNALRGNPNHFFNRAVIQQGMEAKSPPIDPDIYIDPSQSGEAAPSQPKQQESPEQEQNIPKTIEVNMKLTDELKKKILESANSNQPGTFSMHIPIQDLANSTCNSSHCESIVDAATKAVTGEAGGAAEKEGEILNVTEEVERKAKPQKAIKEVPKKRSLKGPKTVIKSGKAQKADEDEGPQEVQGTKQDKQKAADGVLRKEIKLNPVLPSAESTEPSEAANATESGQMNATAENNSTKDEKVKENEHSTDKIKEMVKRETERMAKENSQKDEFLKNMGKPTNSSAVEPVSTTAKDEKVKKTVLKIKDYKFEKDPEEKPKGEKTEAKAKETTQAKKLEPTKTKKKDKVTTIKINKEGTPTANASQPIDDASTQEKTKTEGVNETDSRPSKPAVQKTTAPISPSTPQEKKTTKKGSDGDDDDSQSQPKAPSPKAEDPAQVSPEAAPADGSGDQADSAPMPAAPKPPPPSATKEQKLKYLEDLEKNLQRTKEQVRKEKEKEEAKIKKQQEAAKKDQQKQESSARPAGEEDQTKQGATPEDASKSAPSPSQPAPVDDSSKSSPPGELEAEAKAAEEQATKQVEEQFKPAEDQTKEAEDEEKPVSEEASKPTIEKVKSPSIKKKITPKKPLSPTLQKRMKKIEESKGKNASPKNSVIKNALKPKAPSSSEPGAIKPEDIRIKVKKDEPKIKPEDIEIKVKREEKTVKPEDIQIKIKKDEDSVDNSTGVVPDAPAGSGGTDEAAAVAPIPAAAPAVVGPVTDSGSIIEQAIKQMEETKKIQELKKEIEKEKKVEAKAKAKKEAILKLIKPKNKDAGKKKGKGKASTQEDKDEDLKKRMVIESVADEIQKLNPVKEDVVDQIEQEQVVPPAPIVSKPIIVPKIKSKAAAPVAEPDVIEPVKSDISMKFTGDEDIDEHLYFSNQALSQMQKKHQQFAQQLSSKIEKDEQKRQRDLEEVIKSTKLLEKSNIQDQLDMQKKMQMTQEFKELQDEEDRQENEALKAQMELEIAQAQIQKKQLEQKKALLKANHAQMLQEQQLKKQQKLQQLEALRAAQTQQEEEVRQQEEAEQQQKQQEQLQKQQEDEQAISQAQEVADDVQQKLAKQQQEEQERLQAEALQKEKEEQEKQQRQEAEEKARKERLTSLIQKNQPKYKKLVDQMKQSVDQFSLNQKMGHLQSAIAARQQIENDPEMQEANFQVPDFKIHAVEVFKNSFTFPQIALNEYAQQQLDSLQQVEDKVNDNLNDNIAVNQFIKTTHYVAQQLSQRYGKQWVNPNQDAVNQPAAGKKASAKGGSAAQKDSDSGTNGLSLPQQFANSHDFDPEQLAKDSEKEMQYDQRDLKANAEIEQAVSQQLTPEEQEILNQSSIMTDEEQAKYQKLADGQEADAETSTAEPESSTMSSATKQISQMALTSQDLNGGEQDTVYRQQPQDQSQEQQTQQIVETVEAQPVQVKPQKIISKQPVAVPKPVKSSSKGVKVQAQTVKQNVAAGKAAATTKTVPVAVESPVSYSQGVDVIQSKKETTTAVEPEFQSQDIFGEIAQEGQVAADDIDEIIG